MAAKTSEIVAAVVRDGMSDREKALALNDWITQNAAYDDAAFAAKDVEYATVVRNPQYRNAWTAYGILIDGTAVCAGYAKAYKMLSDAAGLKTVYVTGVAGGGGHAWNKTFMDGKWQVVDPTWNDTTPANQLFGITDEAALTDWNHTLGESWTVGPLIAQYAAE